MDCIFCKIIAKHIPNYTVFENDDVLAFLDIHPCSKGHTVVIPKKHFAEVGEVDSSSWSALLAGVKTVVEKVGLVLKPAGMNVGLNNRPAAGQAVPHVHWHIIPRYEHDGGGSMHSIVKSKDIVDVAAVAALFK